MIYVCPACTHPSRLPAECDNPGCAANPHVSEGQKADWRLTTEKQAAEAAERERIRQIRRRMQS